MLRIRLTQPADQPVEPTGEGVALLTTASAVEAEIIRDFDDPYLELVRLVREATEIEHALLVQYLYAAFSVKPAYQAISGIGLRDPRTLLGVAVQEMEHLRDVNRLLVALGAAPNLIRQDFPYEPDIYPFTLNLEPLSPSSLAKYVYTEAASSALVPGDDSDPEYLAFLKRLFDELGSVRPNHLGSLYGTIIERLHEVIANPPPGLGDLSVWPAILERIKSEGEQAHFDFFRDVFMGTHPGFGGRPDVWSLPKNDPAYPVMPLPVNPSAFEGHPNQIPDPVLRDLAWLSNLHYWIILDLLDLHYRGHPRARDLAIDHMTGPIRTLGTHLAGLGAGLPFDPLSMGYAPGVDSDSTVRLLLRLLDETDAITQRLREQLPEDFPFDQIRVTREALAPDGSNGGGPTPATQYQRVIQILDDAIGGPTANIGVHGTFWRGLTRDQFVATRVFNVDLVVVGQGADSNLVKALKGEAPFGEDLPNPPAGARWPRMPAGLPPVSEENIAFIEQWIDDGAPDDPLAEPEPPLIWRPTNAPPASSRTDDIWFETPDLGWAVNSNGQILATADGGDTWEQQFHDPAVYFRCIGFANESRGWVGTLRPMEKRFYDTHDGGATWNLVPNLPPLAPSSICGLSVVNESVVYASGTNYPDVPPRMMKTLDGGQTWTAWDMSDHATLLVDTYFTSPERGWIVGGKVQSPDDALTRDNVKAVVLYTEDGGQTWVNRIADLTDELPLGEWGWKIQFLNDQVGFVALESFTVGAILKTLDGGQTWERLEVNDPQRNANLEGIGFVDENHGWVGGWGSATFREGYSSETHDGGHTWDNANEIGRFINRFRFLGTPVTVGYASGRTVYKYSSEPVPAELLEALPPDTRFLESSEPAEATRPVRIPITVPEGASRLVIAIWGRFGEYLRTLVDESQPASGTRLAEWDMTNEAGEPADAESIIVRVTVDDRSESQILWIRP
jgi:photosystem II stability/assembly factor-like uncharacterized protein